MSHTGSLQLTLANSQVILPQRSKLCFRRDFCVVYKSLLERNCQMQARLLRPAVVVGLVVALTLVGLLQSTPAHAAPSAPVSQPGAAPMPSAPAWVTDVAPYIHISANFIATIAPMASKYVSSGEISLAKPSVAEYNALPYAERSNDPSTHRAIAPASTVQYGSAGCPQYVDHDYYVYAWYGTGVYIHLTQCAVVIGIAAFATGSGTAWVVAAVCGLSIVGNIGCSEVAGVIAATLAAGGGILYLWDATCNSHGIGVTYVEANWAHGSWAFPSC